MININEYIENSKKNKVNSLDITNHIENVIKDFDVKKAVDKVFKEQDLIYDKTFDLKIKIDNQNEEIHKLAKAGTLDLNDIYKYEKLIKEMNKLVKDNNIEEIYVNFLDTHKENLYNIIQERDKDTINNIENFLQDLNKENIISSMSNVDLNNTEPIGNLNDRIEQVKESINNLSFDNKDIYTNKVIDAVREFNLKILEKKNQEFKEQDVNYDFER